MEEKPTPLPTCPASWTEPAGWSSPPSGLVSGTGGYCDAKA